MALFKITDLSLGKIKAGLQKEIYFPYEGIKGIVKMLSPCDCSVPEDQSDRSRIRVRYIPKQISKHLVEMGATEQAVKKMITIVYIDATTGNEETIVLSFTGIVYN